MRLGGPQARTFKAVSPQQRPPSWPIRPRCKGSSLAACSCSSPGLKPKPEERPVTVPVIPGVIERGRGRAGRGAGPQAAPLPGAATQQESEEEKKRGFSLSSLPAYLITAEGRAPVQRQCPYQLGFVWGVIAAPGREAFPQVGGGAPDLCLRAHLCAQPRSPHSHGARGALRLCLSTCAGHCISVPVHAQRPPVRDLVPLGGLKTELLCAVVE